MSFLIIIFLFRTYFCISNGEAIFFTKLTWNISLDDVILTKDYSSMFSCAEHCGRLDECKLFQYAENETMCYIGYRLISGGMSESFHLKGKGPYVLNNTIVKYEDKCNTAVAVIYESCQEIKVVFNRDGIYRINLDGIDMEVFCDQKTSDGGWIVIQRRIDGSEHFNRTWNEYKNGFGNVSKEFWIGNDKLHHLTESTPRTIRFDFCLEGSCKFAEYESFVVESESDLYKISFSGYKGDGGDSFWVHKGMSFSTFDNDNDQVTGKSCSSKYGKGGWWFKTCHSTNPNGLFNSKAKGVGINWKTFTGFEKSLSAMEIKMK